MQKIDLHQDLIYSFDQDLPSFQNKVETVEGTHAGGLPNYQEADLQIVRVSIWPYEVFENPNKPGQQMVKYNSQKIIEGRKKYEKLRKQNNIYLALNGNELKNTRYIDYRLNFVYHLKGADGLQSIDEFKKLKEAGFRSVQLTREFDNAFAHCHRSTQGGLSEL